jgi:anti-anti-sigma factor
VPVPPPSQASAGLTCRTVGDELDARIIVAGELDIASVPTVDAALRRAESTALVVTLDLRGVECIDSSGAHLVLEAHRRIRRAGGRLVILRGCPEVDWLFALLRIDHELDFVDPPASAAAAPAIGMAA